MTDTDRPDDTQEPPAPKPPPAEPPQEEVGGKKGPEPTRYGDWEHKGIVTDF